MAVRSGFFNARIDEYQQLDRTYGSEQFGSLFDGVISDGIFENYENGFKVSIAPYSQTEGLGVYVDTGRAWYDKTWTLNTSQYRIAIENPRSDGYRRDAIYLKIDRSLTNEGRRNSLIVKKGETQYDWGIATIKAADTSNPLITEYLLAVIEVNRADVATESALKVVDTRVHGKDTKISTEWKNWGVTDKSVSRFAEAIVPTKATVDGIISSLEQEFSSYQDVYQADFNRWFNSIKDHLGSLSNEEVVQLTMLVGEIYESDYVSGTYPFTREIDGNRKLYLSPFDDGSLPPVNINFGYASLPYAENARARKVTINSKPIVYSDQFTYSVGDYVHHNSALYRCITKVESPEPFDSEKWKLVRYYSSSEIYAVGDWVLYSNVLYECTTAIAEPEEWNSEHWTAVT